MLVEVSETIAPLIDQIDGIVRTNYSLSVIKEAEKYLSSFVLGSVFTEEKRNEKEAIYSGDFFGTQELLVSWSRRLRDVISNYNNWSTKMKSVPKKWKADLTPSLDAKHMDLVQSFVATVHELKNETLSLHLPSDIGLAVTFFDYYIESWNHYQQFLQVCLS